MTDFLRHSASQQDPAVIYRSLVAACHERPGDAEVWYRMGCFLHDVKKPAAAAGAFARCVALRTEDHKAQTNLGWSLHLAGRTEEALGALEAAVALVPEAGIAWTNLAQVYGLLGRQREAIAAGRYGVAHGGLPISHMALAFQLFFAGEWEEGFREYEHRFAYRMPECLSFPYPVWRGEKVGRLFVVAGQGLGDTILALRWLPALYERLGRASGTPVVMQVQPQLLGLVRSYAVPYGWTVEPVGAPLPQADAWLAMLSLPVVVGLGEDQETDYLRRVMLPQFARRPGPRRVGVCWSGAAEAEDAAQKNLPFAEVLRLAEVPGVELHSLQVGPANSVIADMAAHGLILDRAPEISDMADTMRVIEGLDLVVSADTAVAHLAGAMGKPVWLLLNQRGGDGRWMRSGETTRWYRSMRIFRRGLDEGWAPVIGRVCEELRS